MTTDAFFFLVNFFQLLILVYYYRISHVTSKKINIEIVDVKLIVHQIIIKSCVHSNCKSLSSTCILLNSTNEENLSLDRLRIFVIFLHRLLRPSIMWTIFLRLLVTFIIYSKYLDLYILLILTVAIRLLCWLLHWAYVHGILSWVMDVVKLILLPIHKMS